MTKGTILIIILLLLILIALFYIILNMNNDVERDFRQKIKKIKTIYEEILVKVEKLPNMVGRTFVKIDNIEKLVNIQQEVRKPLYYLENQNCIDFFIMTPEEICTYTIKSQNGIVSPLESYIEEIEENKQKNEEKMLDDIENTTIIKTKEGQVYKVSPMRKEKTKKERPADDAPVIEQIDLSELDELDELDDFDELDDEPARKRKPKSKEDRVKKYQEKKKKEQRKNKK